ncbi:MAG: formate dehydrogenase accessory protein FdhE [Dehalococcoidia bacterium]|nr:MAG: formate dehydrogenase accessory protein FdhE [Dehalococcoidia bacterium]
MVGYAEILQELHSQAGKRAGLADTIELHCELLEAQAHAQVPAGRLALSSEEAAERLQQGYPLLAPEHLVADDQALAELFDQIGHIVAERRPELAEALAGVRGWLDERRDRIGAVAAEYLREGRVREGEEAGLDAYLLTFVFINALRPFLRVQAQALTPWVDESVWYRGHCPICGGEPDVAALEQESGRRRLLCSRCDSEWAFRRVGCPFCGNDDPQQLAYYASEDQVYRLNVCEQCRRYLKTIDLRQVAGKRLLAAERVLTVAMDVAAVEAGYGVR